MRDIALKTDGAEIGNSRNRNSPSAQRRLPYDSRDKRPYNFGNHGLSMRRATAIRDIRQSRLRRIFSITLKTGIRNFRGFRSTSMFSRTSKTPDRKSRNARKSRLPIGNPERRGHPTLSAPRKRKIQIKKGAKIWLTHLVIFTPLRVQN